MSKSKCQNGRCRIRSMKPVARRKEKLYAKRSSYRIRGRCWDGAGGEA